MKAASKPFSIFLEAQHWQYYAGTLNTFAY